MTARSIRKHFRNRTGWYLLAVLPALFAVISALGQNRSNTVTTGTVFSAWPTVSSDGRSVCFYLSFTQGVLDHMETYVLPTGTMSSPPAARPLVLTLPVDANGAPAKAASSTGNPQTLRNPAVHGNQIYVDWDKKLLAAKLPAVKMENLPLAEVLSKLAGQTQTNLALGIAGMKKAGIDTKMPVSLVRPEGTLREALEELLEAPAKAAPLVVTAEDNVIFITTQAQADHDVVTKAYYTTDLMGNVGRYLPGGTNLNRPANSPPRVAPATPAGSAASPPVSPPPSPFAPPVPTAPKPPGTPVAPPPPGKSVPTPPSPNSLLEIITANVRPDIWKVNGGTIGEIAEFSNRITITAPKSVHALLEGPSHYNPNAVPMSVGYSTR